MANLCCCTHPSQILNVFDRETVAKIVNSFETSSGSRIATIAGGPGRTTKLMGFANTIVVESYIVLSHADPKTLQELVRTYASHVRTQGTKLTTGTKLTRS